MNRNSNKSNIVTTVVVFLVCLVLVTGSTFSLFTSKTGTNIAVTTGNVEMVATIDASTLALYSKGAAQTGKFANGGTAAFNEAKTELTLTNITPGDSVEFDIVLENKSTVDLQYRVNWIVTGDLAEALTATVGGADITSGTSEWTLWKADATEKTQTLAIAIELPLDADDNWESLEANIAFNVEAVQANATGEYSPNAFVNTAAGLQAAINAGATEIILNEDVTLTESLVIPAAPATYSLRETPKTITLDLKGKTISNPNGYVIENQGNIVITGNGTLTGMGIIRSNGGSIVIEDGNFYASSRWQDGVYQHTLKAVNTNVVIKGGNFDATVNGQTNAMLNASENATITINGGSFRNVADGALSQFDPYIFTYEKNGAVVINDGNFYGGWRFNGETTTTTINGGNFTLTTDGHSFHAASTHVLTINGGTFGFGLATTKTAMLKCIADGYNAVDNLDGTYTVMPEGFEFVASGLYKKDNAYHVYTVEGFKYLSAKEFTGYNGVAESVSIVLEADIDMNGAEFSAIIAQLGDTLTFVGNNHKISNIKLISGDGDNTTGQASLFYAFPGSTLNVSDLVIENVVVISDNDDSGFAAVLVGYCEGTANITNVDVINASVTGAKSSGLVVGHLSGKLNVEDSTFAGTVTITDYETNGHYAGQYVGTLAGAASLVDSTATATLGGKLHEKNVGDIYGRSVSGSLEVLTSYVENKVTYYRDEINGDVLLYLVNSDYAESTLTIPEGVTAIGNYAFAYNNNVKTVVLASTVRDLGRGFDSSAVEKVVLNEGLTTISARAFKSTPNLNEVVISSTVTTIADNAFQKSGIKTITIPANVKTVGEAAFGSSKIETVIFEGNINIEGYAFRGCTKLNTVILKGMDVNFVKSTLNGRNSCWFCNGESNNPGTSNITFYVKTDVIKERVLTAMGAERNNTPVIVEMTASEGGYYTDSEGNAFVYDNVALEGAIKAGEDKIVLPSGNYVIPVSAQGKTLTIIGNGETVIGTMGNGSYEGCNYNLQGATVVFENVVINTTSATYVGYAGLKAVYKNCTINGALFLYDNTEFYNCTFNISGDNYNIWTWAAPNVVFDGCTFNSDGKALLLYGGANTKLTVNNCVFNDNGGLDDLKAAIEIGNDYGSSYELIVNNTVVNGYEINDKGINTGSTLWGNKNSMGTDKLNVVVDGVDVY